MLEHTFIALAFVALAFTFASTHPLWDTETQIVWKGAAILCWAIWGTQAGRVVTFEGGETFVESYVSLLIIGWLFAFVLFVLLVYDVMGLIREA